MMNLRMYRISFSFSIEYLLLRIDAQSRYITSILENQPFSRRAYCSEILYYFSEFVAALRETVFVELVKSISCFWICRRESGKSNWSYKEFRKVDSITGYFFTLSTMFCASSVCVRGWSRSLGWYEYFKPLIFG